MVLGLEMSRLARSSKDWHAFFEMCAIFGTLITDEDGVYDGNDPTDKLVLRTLNSKVFSHQTVIS